MYFFGLYSANLLCAYMVHSRLELSLVEARNKKKKKKVSLQVSIYPQTNTKAYCIHVYTMTI